MSARELPKQPLTDALHSHIKGRRVVAAVFTTFTFEQDFFQAEILPALFERSFSHMERVRAVQLEEELRSLGPIAVYYDRTGFNPAGSIGTSLDVRYMPITRRTGVLHPKLVLLLLETPDGERALLCGVLSANLTQAGWWRNLEAAAFREIERTCPFRDDLRAILKLVRGEASSQGAHEALDLVLGFLDGRRGLVSAPAYRSAGGVKHDRLFVGREDLATFIAELNLPPRTYNLEILSPYIDGGGAALWKLIEVLQPRETRVMLPIAPDGSATVTPALHEEVRSRPGVRWGELPAAHLSMGGGSTAPRVVHAKVYRLWSAAEGREYVLVGSVNLTTAAHSANNRGNLEASLLMDLGPGLKPQFWLQALEGTPAAFKPDADVEVGPQPDAPAISIRFDWLTRRADYHWEAGKGATPQRVEIDSETQRVAVLEPVESGNWVDLPSEAAERLATTLMSTALVRVKVDDREPASVLVTEVNLSQKPSILTTFTVEEILRYWSLLTVEQREAVLEKKTRELSGLSMTSIGDPIHPVGDSMFDRFAGVFHAFSQFEKHVRLAMEKGNVREAEYRVFGRKHDSLGSLVTRLAEAATSDAVTSYVTALTARQTLDALRREYGEFFEERRERAGELLHDVDAVSRRFREELPLSDDERDAFLPWFDRQFLTRATC